MNTLLLILPVIVGILQFIHVMNNEPDENKDKLAQALFSSMWILVAGYAVEMFMLGLVRK